MKCVICGGHANLVKQSRLAPYRDEQVEVQREVYQCGSCGEEFLTPDQARAFARNVKNEIRKKNGLLPPERIAEIRHKLDLTQEQLEELLNTGPKVVVRWESGKVIQSGGHDNMLRLLERDAAVMARLQQIQQARAVEQKEYASSHQARPAARKAACA